jgi:hypothetical protein
LIDNLNQSLDESPLGANYWYLTSSLEGNYWSDYTGVDDGSGTGKHGIASDKIGDTKIPHHNDEYPFIIFNGWEMRENINKSNKEITKLEELVKIIIYKILDFFDQLKN